MSIRSLIKAFLIIALLITCIRINCFSQDSMPRDRLHITDSICRLNATTFAKKMIGEKQFNKYLALRKSYLDAGLIIILFTIHNRKCKEGCCVLPIYLKHTLAVDTALSEFKVSQICGCKKGNYSNKHYMTEEHAYEIAKKNFPELEKIECTAGLKGNGIDDKYVFTMINKVAGIKSWEVNAITGIAMEISSRSQP